MKIERYFNKVTIIGVGLLGASIAKALKARAFSGSIAGIDKDNRRSAMARSNGIIDCYAASDADTKVEAANSDLIIICTPVSSIAGIYKKIYPYLKDKTIVTDAGSTKYELLKEISAIENRKNYFIGSHPMAGSEKNGPDAGSAELFNGSVVAVIKDKNTSEINLKKINSFWKYIGARTVNLTSAEHDEIVSETSHLPHIISCIIAYTCMKSGNSRNMFKKIYGKGLADMTRLSLSDPEIWIDILASNRGNIINSIKKFKQSLDFFEKLLQNNEYDGFKKVLGDIKTFRKKIV